MVQKRKLPFEYQKDFKNLDSVSEINKMRIVQSKGALKERDQSETESNSDDEWKKAPFFDNSEYWSSRLSVKKDAKAYLMQIDPANREKRKKAMKNSTQ